MGLGRVRIALQYFGEGSGQVNAFVGGEARWSTNVYDVLTREGYDVSYIPIEHDASGFDLYLDAPWDVCDRLKCKRHVHFSFAPFSSQRREGLANQPCVRAGRSIVSCPYGTGYRQSLLAATENDPFQVVFVPMPFHDIYKPTSLGKPFDRTGVVWATKFWSDPVFDNPEHPHHFYVENAINTLRALVKLGEKVPFTLNFIMSEAIQQANPRHDVPGLIGRLPEVRKLGRMSWTELIKVMGTSKFNLPIGGLQASVLESIFGGSLPLLYSDTHYANLSKDVGLLPPVRVATSQEIFEAMETFWRDEKVYTRAWDFYQELFKDHIREGFLRNFKETLSSIGL